MTEGYSLSDIQAASGSGGMNDWVLIILFALIFGFGGNGMFGNGNRVGEAYATQADIQRAVDLDTLRNGQAGIVSAVKDASYGNLGEMRDLQMGISSGFVQMQNCCCETQRNIDSVRFDMSNYAAQINATTTAAIQKVLDTIQADKIASLTAQVSELKTQNMFCGIPRINPYGYGVYAYQPTCAGNI